MQAGTHGAAAAAAQSTAQRSVTTAQRSALTVQHFLDGVAEHLQQLQVRLLHCIGSTRTRPDIGVARMPKPYSHAAGQTCSEQRPCCVAACAQPDGYSSPQSRRHPGRAQGPPHCKHR